MSVFKVDWNKLVLLLLPPALRKARIYAFLSAAIEPLRETYYRFENTRAETDFLLKYNTGKRNVEIALRARFNDDGIYIENVKPREDLALPFYLVDYLKTPGYDDAIEKSVLPAYLPFHIDPERTVTDFIIYVPETTYLTGAQAIYDFASYFVSPCFTYEVKRY
ncbi:hypothetical protein D0T49_00410 [Paludibacter sp. 221]|uniref:hypothetical protein n=1 Tax=Paludibacter sp. 221 TaxID=2302939 RepID=UPI0013D28642|nr:hypothetical protein [Paludibacter sp. 221]NDV45515.1 hypothetical protein [Paludibacter sp. 221]